MTILEILYNVAAFIVGFVLMSTDHGDEFDTKQLADVANAGIKTIGLLLMVGGIYHLIGMTLLLPKP